MDMKNTCRVQTLRNSVKYSRLKRHTNEEIFHWKRVEPESESKLGKSALMKLHWQNRNSKP